MNYRETDKNNENNEYQRHSESPFLSYARPYFDFIGKGKVYSLVYVIMAIVNLLIPLGVIFVVIESGFLQNSGARVVVSFIFMWLITAFACWIGFQLWWYRRSIINSIKEAEFIATPVISGIIQTFGEWLGTLIAIIGAGAGIIATIFLMGSSANLQGQFGYGFLDYSPVLIIAGPVIGFFIIIIFRFFAEQLRILAAIANNTRDIAAKK